MSIIRNIKISHKLIVGYFEYIWYIGSLICWCLKHYITKLDHSMYLFEMNTLIRTFYPIKCVDRITLSEVVLIKGLLHSTIFHEICVSWDSPWIAVVFVAFEARILKMINTFFLQDKPKIVVRCRPQFKIVIIVWNDCGFTHFYLSFKYYF